MTSDSNPTPAATSLDAEPVTQDGTPAAEPRPPVITVVLVRHDEHWITEFHKFSVVVWAIWLVPYFSPMALRIGG